MNSFHRSAAAEWAKYIGAPDTRLDRAIAIKILPAEFAANVDRLRRFQQEATALSALHPQSMTRTQHPEALLRDF